MALEPGLIINDTYRVEKLLGAGGMAEVYKVVHTRLPKHFALKLMKLDGGERKQFLARFRREADILGTLSHPHIVDVNDWNQLPDGSPYLVMELLEGEDLATFLAHNGALSPAVMLHICKQIGEALLAAHQAGVVHRDLKPGNVFLTNNGAFPHYVKVLDFGVAKVKVVEGEQTPLTANATLMGTPAYMAPEQALGRIDEIDPRTDQFALASMAHEMLTGRQTFYNEGDSVYTILEHIVQGEPPPLPPQVPEPTSRALSRALSKKKEARFPSLKEFLVALGATNETTLGIGAPPPPSPSSERPPSERPPTESLPERPLPPRSLLMQDTLEKSSEPTRPTRPQWRLYAGAIAAIALVLIVAGLFLLFHH